MSETMDAEAGIVARFAGTKNDAARLSYRVAAQRAIKACNGKRANGTVSSEDTAYNVAIDHCIAAIQAAFAPPSPSAQIGDKDAQGVR